MTRVWIQLGVKNGDSISRQHRRNHRLFYCQILLHFFSFYKKGTINRIFVCKDSSNPNLKTQWQTRVTTGMVWWRHWTILTVSPTSPIQVLKWNVVPSTVAYSVYLCRMFDGAWTGFGEFDGWSANHDECGGAKQSRRQYGEHDFERKKSTFFLFVQLIFSNILS